MKMSLIPIEQMEKSMNFVSIGKANFNRIENPLNWHKISKPSNFNSKVCNLQLDVTL